MTIGEIVTLVIMAGILVLFALFPAFEAKSFNECTGGNASYWTALTTELRVTDCKEQ